MEFFSTIFQSVSALLAFMAAAILLWINKEQLHSNRLLAIALLVLALSNLNAVFLYTTWFLKVPRMHKFNLPFSLLLAPTAWLYIKSVLRGEQKSSKKDWLIVIPSVLFLIDLLPYYTMPIAAKKAYLVEFFKNPYMQASFSEGILPPYVFGFLRVLWSSIFIALNFKLIRQFKKMEPKPVVFNNVDLINWLSLFNWLLTGLLLAVLINAIVAPIFKTNVAFADSAAAICVFTICLRLFSKPRLLYGMFQPVNGYLIKEEYSQPKTSQSNIEKEEALATFKVEYNGISEKPDSDTIFSKDEYIRYKKTVETFFKKESPFLQTDYSLEKMVKDTNIPRHSLSAFINREYGMSFREFINQYRVNYFIDNRNDPKWTNLTLEAISKECGYGTRSTFITNFKQITGQTPSDYLKEVRK